MFTTLISSEELLAHLADPAWAVVDCRFSLADPGRGRRDYQEAHIPAAVYANLNEDLSSPVIPGQTGRHPLPDVAVFAATLSHWGIDESTQVVVYDDADGSIAARLWWMLRWLGHDGAAVLDGGWRNWRRAGNPVRGGVENRAPRLFRPAVRPQMLATLADVMAVVAGEASALLVDARAADRFRGENETVDVVAGHIPGALNAPYATNSAPDGRFLSADALQARFQALLGTTPAQEAIVYCGSGVTATHDLLALAVAGLEGARLYAGSWSEWITDPRRPQARGEERE